MKQNYFLALCFVFLFFVQNSLCHVKRTSKAVKLVAYFFQAMGSKGELKNIVA